MLKKTLTLLGVVLFGFLAWYLFLKPYDYLVTLEAKTFPGAINQTIKAWNLSLDDGAILEGKDLLEVRQRVRFGDSSFVYRWQIDPVNDSLSKIRVYISDENNSLMNRLTQPFGTTPFESRTKNTLLGFHANLKEHIANFRVRIEGEADIPESYCAYVHVEGKQVDKALGMMRNYTFLSNFVAEKNLTLNGQPFVQLTDWNREQDSIRYDFCFPIIQPDSLPLHDEIRYKQFEGGKAIKAVYNGNYITSDRAWYALLDHAEKNGLEVTGEPVEVFFNNPNMGGDALQWQADVYLPISK